MRARGFHPREVFFRRGGAAARRRARGARSEGRVDGGRQTLNVARLNCPRCTALYVLCVSGHCRASEANRLRLCLTLYLGFMHLVVTGFARTLHPCPSTRDIEPSRQGQNSRTTRCLGCSCADVPTRVSWSGVRADVNVASVRVASEMFQFVTFCVVVAETLFRLSTRTCPSLPRARSCRYGD